MRIYILLSILLSLGFASAQKINWISMQDALSKQKEVPKKKPRPLEEHGIRIGLL